MSILLQISLCVFQTGQDLFLLQQQINQQNKLFQMVTLHLLYKAMIILAYNFMIVLNLLSH